MVGQIKGYIGTYTEADYHGRGKGIYGFSFDTEAGTIADLHLAAETVNPSYLAVETRFLYAVNELREFEGKTSGAVSAFSITGGGGSLNLINRQPSGGTDPCHIVLDRGKSHAVVSNYSGGTIAVLPVEPSGGLAPAAQVILLSGSGPNRERQEAAHAHSFAFEPQNAYGFACDLGTDRIMAYAFDPDKTAPLRAVPWFSARAGAGPRHGLFVPSPSNDGSLYYGVNELDSTMDVLRCPEGTGELIRLQSIGTLPPGISLPNTAGAIKTLNRGEFVYVSNRGHDSITLFTTRFPGTADYGDTVPSGGRTPRDFEIDPSGRFLLVCHQNSDNLTVLRRDLQTGRLTLEREYAVPSPVCLKFLPQGIV